MQTVEAYQPDEYLPPATMKFCQNVFISHALDLQLNINNVSLDYTVVIGEPRCLYLSSGFLEQLSIQWQ